MGAGVSIVHGIHSIMEPSTAAELGWGLTVLMLSTVVEGYTLLVAVRAVMTGARVAGMQFFEYVKSGRDPVSVAIMAEDGADVAGVITAAVCTKLAEATKIAVRFPRVPFPCPAMVTIKIAVMLLCTVIVPA